MNFTKVKNFKITAKVRLLPPNITLIKLIDYSWLKNKRKWKKNKRFTNKFKKDTTDICLTGLFTNGQIFQFILKQ